MLNSYSIVIITLLFDDKTMIFFIEYSLLVVTINLNQYYNYPITIIPNHIFLFKL